MLKVLFPFSFVKKRAYYYRIVQYKKCVQHVIYVFIFVLFSRCLILCFVSSVLVCVCIGRSLGHSLIIRFENG